MSRYLRTRNLTPFHEVFAQAFEGSHLLGGWRAKFKVSNQTDTNTFPIP